MVVASAQTSEVTVKIAIPQTKTRRRPRRSATEPAVRTTVASASVYASTIHCSPDRLASRSEAMWERAVLTTAMSSISIAVARQTTASVPPWLNLAFIGALSRIGNDGAGGPVRQSVKARTRRAFTSGGRAI